MRPFPLNETHTYVFFQIVTLNHASLHYLLVTEQVYTDINTQILNYKEGLGYKMIQDVLLLLLNLDMNNVIYRINSEVHRKLTDL